MEKFYYINNKVEQTKVISRLIFTFSSQIIRTFDQIECLYFPSIFSYFFHGYDIRSSGIYSSNYMLKVYKAHSIQNIHSVVKGIKMLF